MSDYRERNRRKYENSKVNPKAKKISKKTQRHSTDKDNSTTSTPRTQERQEKSVLVIGDSMVKNIDDRKLERAARAKTVCHSYSGATVKQIEEKSISIGMRINNMRKSSFMLEPTIWLAKNQMKWPRIWKHS